jgi:hypothetical protein
MGDTHQQIMQGLAGLAAGAPSELIMGQLAQLAKAPLAGIIMAAHKEAEEVEELTLLGLYPQATMVAKAAQEGYQQSQAQTLITAAAGAGRHIRTQD